MYVYMYVAVTLRNVLTLRMDWRRGGVLAVEDGEDRGAGSSQRTYSAESSAETSAERSRRLATLRNKHTKKRSPESTVEGKI